MAAVGRPLPATPMNGAPVGHVMPLTNSALGQGNGENRDHGADDRLGRRAHLEASLARMRMIIILIAIHVFSRP